MCDILVIVWAQEPLPNIRANCRADVAEVDSTLICG